jgi:hypothetical protein
LKKQGNFFPENSPEFRHPHMVHDVTISEAVSMSKEDCGGLLHPARTSSWRWALSFSLKRVEYSGEEIST